MNLSQTAIEARLIIRWALIAIGGIIFLWFVFITTRAIVRALLPKEPVLPTVAFGRLPTPLATNGAISGASIEIDTPDGSLPSFPSMVKVYAIPQPSGKINSLDIASKRAGQYGINGNPKALSSTLYRWQDKERPALTITIDIVTGNFNYKYDWVADPKVLPKSFDKDELLAAGPRAQTFLGQGFSGFNDFKDGEVKSSYVHISGSERSTVSSPSEANAVEVDVFRKKLESKYSVVSFHPTQSLMRVLVVPDVPNNSSVDILQASFTHWAVDFDNGSTYPLKTSSQAFDELRTNRAYIVSGKLQGLARVKVTDVQLSYLETENYSSYLQPIFVFKGQAQSGKTKADFIAYVPAVSSDWLRSIN
ncbi:MAG: hypothetical protein Q8P13_04735 [bacterium]|nr:hypothetical protein [bacterium]